MQTLAFEWFKPKLKHVRLFVIIHTIINVLGVYDLSLELPQQVVHKHCFFDGFHQDLQSC